VRARTPVKIYFKPMLALLFPNFFLEDCAVRDFEKELASNKQLMKADEDIKEKHRGELREYTLHRLKLLRRRLLVFFSIIFSAIVVGLIWVAILSANGLRKVLAPVAIFALLSVMCFSWATLGRLGWAGQSWKGDTVFEDLDEVIFRALYWLGAFFALLAVAL